MMTFLRGSYPTHSAYEDRDSCSSEIDDDKHRSSTGDRNYCYEDHITYFSWVDNSVEVFWKLKPGHFNLVIKMKGKKNSWKYYSVSDLSGVGIHTSWDPGQAKANNILEPSH